jgi:hypothetical protein
MNDEMGKELEGSVSGVIAVLNRNSAGKTYVNCYRPLSVSPLRRQIPEVSDTLQSPFRNESSGHYGPGFDLSLTETITKNLPKWFWRWQMSLRISGVLDFVQRQEF